MKRLFDLLLSFVFLVVFGWVYLLVILLYIVSFEFPIFYFQERIGFRGEPFRLIKFRTLNNETNKKLMDRQFGLGKLLRRLSLDEWPQVWHVLMGNMSWVGPRPLPISYLNSMTEEQKQRHYVKPGITGWVQVNGRHTISWERKFALDQYYVEHQSFWLDLRILFQTVGLLLLFKHDRSLEERPLGN